MSISTDGDCVDYDEEVDLEEEDESLALFMGLLRRDKAERVSFLRHLARHSVQLWLRKRHEDATAKKLLQTHMPSILRISLTSPFEDVREELGTILQDAKVVVITLVEIIKLMSSLM